MTSIHPDLDEITRNLIALDLAHLAPEEATEYEHELSAIASLNEALEITTTALHVQSPEFWQQLHPLISDAAALLTSQLAPLLDRNAERSFLISEQPIERPLAFATH
ncbi:MAG: hypothetical protein AAFQ63_15635 [Cyanobacteria bacterium J06621_11]